MHPKETEGVRIESPMVVRKVLECTGKVRKGGAADPDAISRISSPVRGKYSR